MENNYILFFPVAVAAAAGLKIFVWLFAKTNSKSGKLALNIGKCVVLLGIQIMLLTIFSGYGAGSSGIGGCIAASCITAVIGAVVYVMQFFADRRYPMTDEQKMHLSEL